MPDSMFEIEASFWIVPERCLKCRACGKRIQLSHAALKTSLIGPKTVLSSGCNLMLVCNGRDITIIPIYFTISAPLSQRLVVCRPNRQKILFLTSSSQKLNTERSIEHQANQQSSSCNNFAPLAACYRPTV